MIVKRCRQSPCWRWMIRSVVLSTWGGVPKGGIGPEQPWFRQSPSRAPLGPRHFMDCKPQSVKTSRWVFRVENSGSLLYIHRMRGPNLTHCFLALFSRTSDSSHFPSGMTVDGNRQNGGPGFYSPPRVAEAPPADEAGISKHEHGWRYVVRNFTPA